MLAFGRASNSIKGANNAQQPCNYFSRTLVANRAGAVDCARTLSTAGLVGSCWTATFPDGKATDEKCFEWVFDRKFIRERHIVRGQPAPYAGETLFAWDAKAKHVVFTYWNSLGGVSTGSGEYGTEGIVFPERHVTDSGVREMKAVWKQLGPNRFSVWQGEKAGDQWKTLWTMEFRRLPAGSRN